MSVRCCCPCWPRPYNVQLDESLIEEDPFKKDLAKLQVQIEKAKGTQDPVERLRLVNALNEFTAEHTPVE